MMNRYFAPFFAIYHKYINNGQNRSIKAKKNILASLVIKGFSIAISLVLIPLTIDYINPTRFGIWLTLSSIVGWFSFFDIGFGNGLRNRFAEAKASENFELARIYVSTTYAVLTIIFIIVWILFFICNFFVNWSKILNAPSEMATELSTLAIIVFSFFCIQIILKTINTVLIADQQPAKSSFLDMLGQLIGLAIIFILTKTTHGSLILLGLSLGFAPIFILIIASIWLYFTKYKYFIPSFRFVKFSYSRDIMSLGLKFFIIQIAVVVLYQSNNIIIAQVSSLEDVTIFNIAYKYMGLIYMVFTIIISPFWSAFTEAYVVKDYQWMRNTVKKLNWLAGLSVIGTILLAFSAKYGYKLWIGDAVSIPFKITYTMGIYTVLLSLVALYTEVLNGVGKIKLQLISYSTATILHVPLAVYLGRLYGIQGVIMSASFFCAIIAFFSFVQVNKILNQKDHGIWSK